MTAPTLPALRHLAGPDLRPRCVSGREDGLVRVFRALPVDGQLVVHAFSDHPDDLDTWYDCPACRETIGGTEPMTAPPEAREIDGPADLARGVATAGSWAWDASNYDYQRGAVNVALAVSQGIAGMTFKATEGTNYRDPYWAATYAKMRASRLVFYGAYHVLYPSSMASISAQLAFFTGVLDATAPGWRSDPRFVVQIDAEKFAYMTSAPTVADCNAFRAGIITARGGTDCLGYLPRWLYGTAAGGYAGPLWSSAYVGGTGSCAQVYPGDNGTGWQPYGKTPLVWQFSSSVTIAGQAPSDANAIKLGAAALLAAVNGGNDDMATISQADFDSRMLTFFKTHTQNWAMLQGLYNQPIANTSAATLGTVQQLFKAMQKFLGVTSADWESPATTLPAMAAQLATVADPTKFAAAVVAALPEGGPSVDQMVTALREVFAQLATSPTLPADTPAGAEAPAASAEV